MPNFIDKILDVEVINMPVGKAFLLTTALGLSTGIGAMVDRLSRGMIPPAMVPFGVAAMLTNIPMIKRNLGADLTDLMAITAIASGVNQQFNVTGNVVAAIDRLLSFVPGMGGTAALPTTAALPAETNASGGLSGYNMGSPMGQLPQVGPNVDDVDLTLLSARGFQTA